MGRVGFVKCLLYELANEMKFFFNFFIKGFMSLHLGQPQSEELFKMPIYSYVCKYVPSTVYVKAQFDEY